MSEIQLRSKRSYSSAGASCNAISARIASQMAASASVFSHGDICRGAPVLRLPARADAKRSPRQGGFADAHTVLYDLHADPRQMSPCENTEAEAAICKAIRAEMALHEAPAELYDRFDLS